MKKLLKTIIAAGISLFLLAGTQPSFAFINAEEGDGITTYPAGNPYYGGWSNCTWSAWQLVYQSTGYALPSLGNAGEWFYNAMMMGYEVSQTPRANSVGVWTSHVVYITQYDADSNMLYMQEGGFLGGYNEGWIAANSSRSGQGFLGYIYIPTDGYTPVAISWDDQAAIAKAYQQATQPQEQSAVSVTEDEVTEIEKDVVRVDDAQSDETAKKEDQQAAAEVKAEDKQQTSSEKLKLY